MNVYQLLIVVFLVAHYLLALLADLLNLRHLSPEVPPEVADACDPDTYRRAQRYLAENTRFGFVTSTFDLALILAFLLSGGFAAVDAAARRPGWGEVGTGLLFAGLLTLGLQLVHLPFAVYDTFVIEQRYGFNRTTPRTFALDWIKGLALTAVLGGAIFAAVIGFFLAAGRAAWLGCWAVVIGAEVALVFLAPYVILPLFNKFAPLEPGPLRSAVEAYAERQRFRMRGIFTMDGSRRSSKTNAFFTGFGRSRRIVLFDTLIRNHSVPEIVAVVAHEMGHYRRRHVLWAMLRSALSMGMLFFLAGCFLRDPELFRAFRVPQVSVYASLVFFAFLYTPVASLLAVAENWISRRQEYAADAFAARTTGDPGAMERALKKLSVDNLSNLTPHPLKVFLTYSHPPAVARIRALRSGCRSEG